MAFYAALGIFFFSVLRLNNFDDSYLSIVSVPCAKSLKETQRHCRTPRGHPPPPNHFDRQVLQKTTESVFPLMINYVHLFTVVQLHPTYRDLKVKPPAQWNNTLRKDPSDNELGR